MNVTELALTPAQYGRANYLKREIVAALRYAAQHGTTAKKAVIAGVLADAVDLANTTLGTTATGGLAATQFVVEDGADYPVAGGGTLVVAVAAGVPTFTYVP